MRNLTKFFIMSFIFFYCGWTFALPTPPKQCRVQKSIQVGSAIIRAGDCSIQYEWPKQLGIEQTDLAGTIDTSFGDQGRTLINPNQNSLMYVEIQVDSLSFANGIISIKGVAGFQPGDIRKNAGGPFTEYLNLEGDSCRAVECNFPGDKSLLKAFQNPRSLAYINEHTNAFCAVTDSGTRCVKRGEFPESWVEINVPSYFKNAKYLLGLGPTNNEMCGVTSTGVHCSGGDTPSDWGPATILEPSQLGNCGVFNSRLRCFYEGKEVSWSPNTDVTDVERILIVVPGQIVCTFSKQKSIACYGKGATTSGFMQVINGFKKQNVAIYDLTMFSSHSYIAVATSKGLFCYTSSGLNSCQYMTPLPQKLFDRQKNVVSFFRLNTGRPPYPPIGFISTDGTMSSENYSLIAKEIMAIDSTSACAILPDQTLACFGDRFENW